MKTTNELMAQFGGHAKYVSFNFNGNHWVATYNSGADEHTERGDTIEHAVENLLQWYAKTKDPKHIAEKLYGVVKKIAETAQEVDSQYGESPRKIIENIVKLCADTMSSIETDESGNVIWGAVCTQQPTAKTEHKVQAKPPVQTRGSRPKKEIGDDGLPPYFEVKTPSYMFVRCYGYNPEGERVFINIDMQNYKNTSINTIGTLNKADFDEEEITPIAEDEFNSRYDEAGSLIMNAANFQPIDYSNVEIIKGE